jgi:uncharacterized membrane protein
MTDEKPEISDDEIETALIHLYRGEVQRVNTWRNRLDRTPYWSLVMVAGMISWAFSAPARSPALILVTIPLTSGLLMLEANRYQMHEVWRSRMRLLEENFFANLLDPDTSLPRREWMKVLSQDLREPEFKVSFFTALSLRLRRIYLWIYTTIIFGWFMKLTLHPTQVKSVIATVKRARIGFVPGIAVVFFMVSFLVLVVLLALIGIYPVKEERGGQVLEEEPGYEWRREEEGGEE